MDIIEKDLEFIITMAKKYNTNIASWYWREISETHEEWVQRRYKLSIEKGYIKGIVLVNNIDIKYFIPLPKDSLVRITVLNKTYYLDYINLYKDIENLIVEQTQSLIE